MKPIMLLSVTQIPLTITRALEIWFIQTLNVIAMFWKVKKQCTHLKEKISDKRIQGMLANPQYVEKYQMYTNTVGI